MYSRDLEEIRSGPKIVTEQKKGYVETACCKGRLRVVYRSGFPNINFGKDFPAFFYCSICHTACNGNSFIIGKYDATNDKLIL